ncbi:AMP-binding protein [Vineibacter terrae]|uniref:AMP-binding protein n=1 Tax=Vineibacter terrae TaxID=2586908 RepID=UPI002E379E9E|nr:AMP-binding protein [Vineibacter terrae]HEX2891477.1 AMP-binding protein [Vineibacter terrae]
MKALRDIDIAAEDLTFGRILARAAARNGDKPYLLFEDRSYSYADLDSRTNRIANALLAFGIRTGDHVAILMGNCPETLFLTYALGKIGAVVVPVNTATKGDLLLYFLEQSDSTAIMVGSESLARYLEVAARAPRVTRAVIIDEPGVPPVEPPKLPGVSILAYAALEDGADRPPGVAVDIHEPHGIFYTSGTTGPSKGVVRSNAGSWAFSIGRAQYIGYQKDDVIYTCLPLFHGNAMGAASMPALAADATLALSRRFSARAYWDEIRRYGVTQFNLLSSMTNILWGQPAGPGDRDHKVHRVNMVPVAEFAPQFAERFGVEIVSSYSLTDFGQGTFLQPGYPASKYRSAGKPRPDVELVIMDDDDRIAGPGVAGEICMRSDNPLLGGRGYYKMPDANADANRGGWFHTGDRGMLDEDGYLFFVDRKKDAIRRRGENISSWEVEQVIGRHPAVMEVAVYPVRSEMSEDEVMASVVCRPGQILDPVDLVRFCEANMSYFMVPRFLEFLPALPKTMTEKVQKNVLKQSAEERLGHVWDREKAGVTVKR